MDVVLVIGVRAMMRRRKEEVEFPGCSTALILVRGNILLRRAS